MEAELERTLSLIDSGSYSYAQLEDHINILRASVVKYKDISKIDRVVALKFFSKVVHLEPCNDEAILMATHLLKPSEITIEDSWPVSVKIWVRLGMMRTSPPALLNCAQLREWNIFDVEEINPIRQSTYKSRLIECLIKVLNNMERYDEYDGDFINWLLGLLYGCDDLALQKAKELLVTIILKCSKGHEIFKRVLMMESGLKSKYQTVAHLYETIAKKKISNLEEFEISDDFLAATKQNLGFARGLAPACSDVIIALMQNEADPDKILGYLFILDENFTPQIPRYVLPRAIKSFPGSVKRLFSQFKGDSNHSHALEAYIILLSTISSHFGGMGQIDLILIERALRSSSEDISLGAFSCLCQLFGPNKPADESILSLIQTGYRYLLLESTANSRQRALVALHDLFVSLFSRLYALLRDEPTSEELCLITSWIVGFLQLALDVVDKEHSHQFKCIDLSLYTCLEFKKAIKTRDQMKGNRPLTPIDYETDKLIEGIIKSSISTRVNNLISCILENSFDSNRQAASELIRAFNLIAETEIIEEKCLERLKNPRESISDGAALLLSVIQIKPSKLITLLKSQLSLCKDNMAMAASDNNLNGTLRLLSRMKIPDDLLLETIGMAIEIGNIVSDFASQPSPEGADLGQFFDHTGTIPSNQASQLILTFCWRAIKESTNLLGIIANDMKLESLEQIKPIIDHLVGLLLTLRHPGAFCAVEEPLQMVASAMFKSGIEEIRNYPEVLLKKAVNDCLLQPEIQVTRRSAGLPFCISAILSAVNQRGKQFANGEALVSIPMDSMLELIEDLDLALQNPSPSIIHGLNILRALFRNGSLDYLTGSKVTRCFEACFRSFGSSSWSVRNGAMMLFGALVRRVFGCGHSPDPELMAQVDVRQISLKFPNLIDCFRKQLLSSNESTIYPLLSVLQRLRFSTGAITQHADLFEATIKFLFIDCTSNSSAKIRAMSCRLLVKSLLASSPELVWPHLIIFAFERLAEAKSANELEGKLNIILKIVNLNLDLDKPVDIGLMEKIWKSSDLPAAIRYPALAIWKNTTGQKISIKFFKETAKLPNQPYLYELYMTCLKSFEADGKILEIIASMKSDVLKYRLLAWLLDQKQIRPLEFSLSQLSLDTDRFNHYGLMMVSLGEQCSEKVLSRFPKNPTIVGHSLEKIAASDIEKFLSIVETYLIPENGFSDVVRLAVVRSFPDSWPTKFNLSVFKQFRLALVDDDEEVRIEAVKKFNACFDRQSPLESVPVTLEKLHEHAAKTLGQEYLDWRESRLRTITEDAQNPSALFAAEPLNLFANPSWEYDIKIF